jgi:hypothetical protein
MGQVTTMLLAWLTSQDNGNGAKSYKNQLLGVKNGYKLRKTIHNHGSSH